MTEVLYKVLIILLVNSYCLTKDVTIKSYDFIVNNYIPSNITKFNIGAGMINIDNEYKKFFITQNWISENLYIGGMISSEKKDIIDIDYNINIGYCSNFIQSNYFNIIYDLSYHNKRLIDTKNKWKKVSIILNINNQLGLTYNYIFSNCKTNDINNDITGCNQLKDNKYADYLNFDFFKKIGKKYLFNIGIKKIDHSLYPYFSLRYNL